MSSEPWEKGSAAAAARDVILLAGVAAPGLHQSTSQQHARNSDAAVLQEGLLQIQVEPVEDLAEDSEERCSIWGCCCRSLCCCGILIFGCVALILVGLWRFQEELVFQPEFPLGMHHPEDNPRGFQQPSDVGMSYVNLTLVASDQVHINAWLMYQSNAGAGGISPRYLSPTLIYLHGNAWNIGGRMPHYLPLYEDNGLNILAVEYRGYGDSEGAPSEEGLYLDAQAALDFIRDRADFDNKKIFVYGESVGGAVAINLAHERGDQLAGLMLENSFTSMTDMAVAEFPFFKPVRRFVDSMISVRMDSLTKIKNITMPTFFVSGEADEIVPPSQMERLYTASGASIKTMLRVPGGRHNDSWESEEYPQAVEDYLNEAVSSEAAEGDSMIHDITAVF